MRMVDIIAQKRDGGELTEAQLAFVARGAADGSLPDYQLSALLMAIVWRSMSDREVALLTRYMAESGEMADLSGLPGITVDKHSTGGVGDKTTLVAAPIAAACGAVVAKMSGRGLGFTGGTVDKLEAIPGYTTTLSRERFLKQVETIGIALIGQSGRLAPADKRLYALRDVTATVESMPLIASSIMSKKLASGAQCILLDVKYGSGAFMKEARDAAALAQMMCRIGTQNGRRMAALLTGMQRPLGCAVGNALEVAEAIEVLRGGGPDDLRLLSLELAAGMLELAGFGSHLACIGLAEHAVSSGAALETLCRLVAAQGGDPACIEEPQRLPKAPFSRVLEAPCDGFLTGMDTQAVGRAAMLLGAGRAVQEDTIDPGAGLLFCRRTGDAVRRGEPVATLYSSEEGRFEAALQCLCDGLCYGEQPPEEEALIRARITSEAIQWF